MFWPISACAIYVIPENTYRNAEFSVLRFLNRIGPETAPTWAFLFVQKAVY